MVIVERWLSLISLEEIVRVLLIVCEIAFNLVLFKVYHNLFLMEIYQLYAFLVERYPNISAA